MGWRVTDQRQTYNMGSSGQLRKVWEVTVDTDIGPSFKVDIPENLYFNRDEVKKIIETHYEALVNNHGLSG